MRVDTSLGMKLIAGQKLRTKNVGFCSGATSRNSKSDIDEEQIDILEGNMLTDPKLKVNPK